MKNRKWQRILSWILTMTMLLGTFESNILAVNAMDDEAVEAEADADVEEPEILGTGSIEDNTSKIKIEGSGVANLDGEVFKFTNDYGKAMDTYATFTATVPGDASNTVTWKLFENKTNWKEVALPAGLEAEINNNVYSIKGTPAKTGAASFVLSAVSANGASANAAVQITTSSVITSKIEVTGGTDVTFGTAESPIRMGYTADASAASSSSNVVPKTISFKNSTGVDLTGLTIKLDDEGKKYFELTNGGTNVNINKNDTFGITVVPKTGVIVKNQAANDVTVFNGIISLSANYLKNATNGNNIEIPVTLNLAHNITVAVTKGGEAYTKANLGTVSAGDAIPTIVYTATGADGLTWNENSLLNGTASKLPEGVTGNINGATLTIQGTPAVKDANLKDYHFSPSVNDANGNYVQLGEQNISVSYANVAYSVDGEKLGDSISKAVNTGYLQADGKLVIDATNKSASEVTVKASVNGTDFSVYGNAEQKIAAGDTVQFVINPNTGWTSEHSTVVTLSGNGIGEFTTTYKLIVSNGLVITNPVSDNSVINATVGEPVAEFKFAAKGITNGGDMTWSVSADKPFNEVDTEFYGDTYKPVSANELKTVYGLEVKNGVLTGTPASANNIAFTVSVNQGTSTSSNVVLVKIASSNSAIAILDADGNELKIGDKGANGTALTLPAVGTNLNDVKGVSANVTIKNNSAVNIGDVEVTLDGKIEKFNTTSNKFEDAESIASNWYEIVGSPVSVTASSSKTFTIQPKVENIAHLDYSDAGTYRIKVKVNTNKNVTPKYFYAIVEVKAAPKILGYTTTNDTVTTTNSISAKVNEDIVSRNMVAVSDNETVATYPLKNVEWSWTAASSETSIPEGLALSAAGKITGTPTKAGTYTVSINVLNKDTGISATQEYTINVAASGSISLKDNNGNAVSSISFDGAVKGAAAGNGSNVFVWAGSDADVKNITISVKDASASYNGSAAHFTVDKSSIATLTKGTNEKIVITPADTTKSGTYHAIVTVSSNEVVAQTIDVWFVVVDALTVTPATATVNAEVGQAFSTSVNASAVEYKDKNGVVVSENKLNEVMIWTEVSSNWVVLNGTSSVLNGTGLTFNGTKTDAKGFKYAEIANTDGPSKSGTYTVSVNGLIEATTDDGLKIPSQSANSVLTINIAKSASVNVIDAKRTSTEQYPAGKMVSANGLVTGYTFGNRSVGYKDAGAKETVEFTVANGAKIALAASANTASKAFVIDGALKETASIGKTENKKFTVTPSDNLAAGTYTADIVISGKEIVPYTVTVSFTVEPAAPAISVSDDKCNAIDESGIALAPVKKGTSDIAATTISVNNSGNIQVKIDEIREVKDAAGTNFDVGATGQKLTIVKNDAEGKTIVPSKFESFTVAPVNATTAGVYEAYVKVRYSAAGAEQTPLVFKVNYVIYKDSVSVNVTPAKTEGAADNTISLNTVSVNEGYTQTDATGFTKNITVTVGEAGVTGDATESIYDLKVSIGNADQFVLGSADAKVNKAKSEATLEVLAKGSSCGFTVAPKTGLPYGTYNTTLTITAKNLKDGSITKTITFSVLGEKATTYTADKVTTEGIEDEFTVNADRIWNTLQAVIVKETSETKKSVKLESNTFKIDANKDGKDDITVEYNSGKVIIKKVDNSGLTADTVSVNRGNAKAEATNLKPDANGVSFNTIYFNLENIVSFNAAGGTFADNGKDVISVNVANGKALAADKFPAVSMNNASLKSWMVGNKEFTSATTVSSNLTVTALWSEHEYPASASGNTASINWTWNGTAEDNFKDTYVTIYCIDADCPDRAASAVKINATVVKSGKDASCTTGAANVFTATASKDGKTYTDTKTVTTGEGLGHEWKFDETSVVWAADYSSATISKNCVAKYHDEERDDAKQVGVITTNISFNGVSANCTTSGNGVYTATWTKAEDPAISENIVVSIKMDEIPAFGHKWAVKSVESDGSFETAPTKATLNIVCERDAEHKESVSASKIELVSSNDTQKTYKYSGEATDGQAVEGEETFYSHKEHDYTVSFNWISVSTNKAETSVTAEATCKIGGEKTALEVTLTDKTIGSKIEYTATAIDPNGKVWTSKKNIDTKTGEEKDGPAGQPLVEGGDIVIIGLNEEGYPYSNKKAITPAFTVMDGDVVLALSKDYTVKYKNNKQITDAAIIEVTGKGNYQGKSTSATFKIYDPVAQAKNDGVELIDGTVKKIAKISPVTYNGTAQYPEQIVVTMKDKSTVTMKHEGDGVYVNASEEADAKQLVVTVTNNIKKGSAIVAVAAADGKVKTASFKINAADISTATVADDMEATFAVKGTRPDHISVIWKNGDDEEVELVEGQDFTVSLKDNKAVGTGKLILKGKGNFAKKNESGTFKINALEVTEIAGVAAYEGVKAKAVKVTILDGQGVALPAKALNVAVKDEEGNAVDPKTKLAAGKYTVVVTSKNANVTIDEAGIEKDVTVGANIGKAKIDAKKLTVTYTGEPIELTDEQLASVIVTLKVGKEKKTLVAGEDYKVVGYTNNVKKGNMTVTIEGTGEETERGTFSGTKTFKVKIVAKNLDAKTE